MTDPTLTEHLKRVTVPECKAQAVCVNGRHCIDAARCLRAGECPVVPASQLAEAVERTERAERQRDEYKQGWLSRGRELNGLYDRIADLHRACGGRP